MVCPSAYHHLAAAVVCIVMTGRDQCQQIYWQTARRKLPLLPQMATLMRPVKGVHMANLMQTSQTENGQR